MPVRSVHPMRMGRTAATPEGANDPDRGIQLLDAGAGRRLERLGARVVDRPAPAATEPRRAPDAWSSADLRFESGRGWSGRASIGSWQVQVDGLTVELRPMPSGGVGLFPEQLANLPWLVSQIARLSADAHPPEVLNLFAHTGLVTLAATRAGAAVVHVDSSRPSLAWARRNAELSGLADRPTRWLVDDAGTFVARELRRGRRYDGLILDPPSFGRAGARSWRLRDDLAALLEACARVLAPDAFVLLTAHTTGVDGGDLADVMTAAFGRFDVEVAALELDGASGARLQLGWAVRIAGGPAR